MSRRPASSNQSAGARKKASDVHTARVRRLRSRLAEDGLDALLVTYPHDIRYLTGFSGEDSYALITRKQFYIISDFRFQEELARWRSRATIVIRQKAIIEATGELLADLKPGIVGVQGEHLSSASRASLAKKVGERKLRDTSGLLLSLRVTKDASEVSLIRRAAKIQEEALEAVLPLIRPGQGESLIAARLEYEMKSRGASGTSFETIVAARANGSKPHYRPGATRTGANTALLIDWGARLDGYCSDMTRTFALGRWPAKLREAYGVVLEAHLAAIDAIRPGRTCGEIDSVARGIIERAGYGDCFGHGLGHGIGVDIHEQPRLAKGIQTALVPGMVVTVEPGIYLPGVGGIRIEDDILVTSRGSSNLCSLPKDLKWATLHG